ncbi:Cell cycle protein GpsB [Mesoplasma sp. JKS002658]|nr:DivIVA domain-containing protein [Mesoplasma sp. JKS002660]MCL8211275.1 Cell cycle protein GpsB [Mesoplasma sp. JKS002664]MCL8212128.1 Cell cycle protein GpsB [Mesoplasma sp. JKS002662]MCL8212608.1 Cell cycle protein GpsB [Mesoplasma sp. JKS002661]MCL8214343.1 Cell cycle protein GpsB [Mesoplasma sp. JKS002658]MCL8214613.1 Cell cycle protein GpsB [Mesoplasma sp. JKS002663]MCL8215663.1 Cell cycle protein GpsB [Mesoplasma sp. JKS002659]MCL8216030.1 Cell cycle protein GpsB [Mesoplasma sp. JKS
MAKTLNYDKEEILNKDFQVVNKGYNPQEVDLFLDEIAIDYEYYQNQIDSLTSTLNEANQTNSDLTAQVEELKNSFTQKIQKENKQTRENFGNIDMVKRIASIEKELFDLKSEIQTLVKGLDQSLTR